MRSYGLKELRFLESVLIDRSCSKHKYNCLFK